jgi:hypothetical protein
MTTEAQPKPLIFFCWLDCKGEGQDAESAVYVVAPDKDKADDYIKHIVKPPYHQYIKMEQVEEMTREIGWLSWRCWQAELERHPELRKK